MAAVVGRRAVYRSPPAVRPGSPLCTAPHRPVPLIRFSTGRATADRAQHGHAGGHSSSVTRNGTERAAPPPPREPLLHVTPAAAPEWAGRGASKGHYAAAFPGIVDRSLGRLGGERHRSTARLGRPSIAADQAWLSGASVGPCRAEPSLQCHCRGGAEESLSDG